MRSVVRTDVRVRGYCYCHPHSLALPIPTYLYLNGNGHMAVQVYTSGSSSSATPEAPGLLQRLGRVLKEKAAGDFERFFKGTVKTRERLGVRAPHGGMRGGGGGAMSTRDSVWR